MTIRLEVLNDALDVALERQIGHLLDVVFQGTDEERFERFRTGIDRASGTYDKLSRMIAKQMDEL